MKRIAFAIVLGSTLTALAGSVAADDAGIRLPARSTYADSHPVSGFVAAAFPGAADDAGIRLPSVSTSTDQQRAGRSNAAQPAFPQGIDEAGHYLPPMPVEADQTGN